ncbi:MAG TPA: alpha/beta hydrolase [Pyrinomonadaceae bacterium]|nr:alpha/beta hydrolase [Pyrinomonadaceae bacterium]
MAVVLVHGFVVSGLYMVPTAERLARFYRVYVPDLPGFGRSDKPRRPLDVAGLAGALAAWMDAEGLRRAVLVGNSMGCQVIAEMVAREPERAEGLVLTGPTVDPAARTARQQLARLLIDATREKVSLLLVHFRSLLEAGLWRAWRTARHALANRIEENLPRLDAPALVVRGSRDPLAPQVWCERVAGLLPRGRLAVVPGGPHALNYSAPDELASLIRDFVENEVRGSPTRP